MMKQMKSNKNSVILACFSPPVMIATFLLELLLAIYVFTRYKLNPKGRAILLLLVCLAVFQGAEFYVCTQSEFATFASRLGYTAITLLPPLGLYLMSLLTKPLSRMAKIALLSITGILVSYFLLAPSAFQGYVCTGNYVIFQIGTWQAYVYGTFYFGLLALSIIRGCNFTPARPKAINAKAIKWLLAGYAVFIVPVATLVVLQPDTRRAVPSIMCGFAVTLALILATRITPLVQKRK